MTFIRCEPQPISDLAAEWAAKMILAFMETVHEVAGDQAHTIELPNIAEFDPRWWQDQIDVHLKFASGRIQETAEAKIRNVARCMVLRQHCGRECVIDFDKTTPYGSRSYLADTRAWPKDCPKTLRDLKFQVRMRKLYEELGLPEPATPLVCPTHYQFDEEE